MTLSSYTQHDPIDIRNDTALAYYAVSGTGNPGSPYILEGWNITTEGGMAIRIMSTTKHFVVRDCWLQGAGSEVVRGLEIHFVASETAVIERVHSEFWGVGIEVASTSKAIVKGCSIRDCGTGLIMTGAINSTVFNNTIFNNSGWGIGIYSHSTIIANNTLWGNTHGLGVFSSNNVLVENNTMIDDGISLQLDSIASYETISERNNLVNGLPLALLISEKGTTYDGGIGQAILINCTNVKLSNQNLSYCETGAFLRWCTDCQISDSHLDHNDASGVYVDYSDNIYVKNAITSGNRLDGFQLAYTTINITGCDIMANTRGVELTSEGEISIQDNTFVNNTEYGISLSTMWNVSITDNTFTDDGVFCYSYSLEDYASYSKNVTGNLVNGRPLVFYYALQDVTISSPHGQIFLANCSNVILDSLDCSHTVIGVGIAYSSDCSIIDSDCSSAKQIAVVIIRSNFTLVQNVNCDHSIGIGIRSVETRGSELIDNSCSGCANGIDLFYSWTGLVRGNILTGNRNYGLRLMNSEDTLFYGNICDSNLYSGIYAELSVGLMIVNNTCNSNAAFGIEIWECSELLVHSNNCKLNPYGGIFVGFAWSCIFASNRLEENGHRGLYVIGGYSIDINWNTITANSGYGVYMGASHSTLSHNIIALNNDYGVYLTSCTNVSVHHNIFVNNNGDFVQARDTELSVNHWYDPSTAEGNYWSDWDGAGPYLIDGNPEALDIYPLGESDFDSDSLYDSWEIANGLDPYSADSDSDSLPDAWEVMHGLNPLVDDTGEDLDADGLSNIQEFILGLNPTSEDSDGDLIPDLWELENYLNPLFNDADLDPDGDGVSNLNEYLEGTNPHVYNTPSTTTSTTTPTEIPGDTLTVIIAGVGGFALAIILVLLIQKRSVSK
jgi:parallel beta-helix repeat protein